MATTQLNKFSDIDAFLSENNVPHKSDLTSQAIELPVTTPPLSGVMYVRWDRKLPYVQLVYPFVGYVPAERVQEVESGICHANTVIPLPGFGFEYEKRFVYMRLCVPIFEEGMLVSSFQRLLLGVLQNAKDFIGPFRDVVAGQEGAQIMALAVKHKNELDAGNQTVPKA
jgi:hypothetical protein